MLRNIFTALFYCAAVCGAGLYAAGQIGRAMEMGAALLNWR